MLLLVLFALWWLMTSESLQKLLHVENRFLIDLSTYFLLGPTPDPRNLNPSAYFDPSTQIHSTDIAFLVLLPFLMLGVAGAVLSNMLSKEPFRVATGATTRYFVYHLLVKPLIGGFAALVLIFVERSGVLLAVVPPGGAASNSRAAIEIPVHSVRSGIFTIAMLSISSGFFADRMLSSIMDRALNLLFMKSEKTIPSAGATSQGGAPRKSKA